LLEHLKIGTNEEIESRLLYELHDLVLLREHIKKVDGKLTTYLQAYNEINRRVSVYLELGAIYSYDFLFKEMLVLIAHPEKAQSLRLYGIDEKTVAGWLSPLPAPKAAGALAK
jgi:hypothetical protein